MCRPLNSEWASPLHKTAKKVGSSRPWGGYRALNKSTIHDSYPGIRIEYLKTSGGFNTKSLVWNLLKYTIDNATASKYNWSGKQKKALEDLKFMKIIKSEFFLTGFFLWSGSLVMMNFYILFLFKVPGSKTEKSRPIPKMIYLGISKAGLSTWPTVRKLKRKNLWARRISPGTTFYLFA